MPTPPDKPNKPAAPQPADDGFPKDKDVSKPPPGSDQDTEDKKEEKG